MRAPPSHSSVRIAAAGFSPGSAASGAQRGEGSPAPGETSQLRLLAAHDPRQTPAWGGERSPARGSRAVPGHPPAGSGPGAAPRGARRPRLPRDSPEISAWGTPLRLKPLAPYSCRTSAQLLALLPLSPRAGAEATHSSQNPHGKTRILVRWPRHLPCEGQSQGPCARGAAPSAGSPGGTGGRGRRAGGRAPVPAACGKGSAEFSAGRRRGSAERGRDPSSAAPLQSPGA